MTIILPDKLTYNKKRGILIIQHWRLTKWLFDNFSFGENISLLTQIYIHIIMLLKFSKCLDWVSCRSYNLIYLYYKHLNKSKFPLKYMLVFSNLLIQKWWISQGVFGMMMAIIGKKDYVIGYDTLEWIGCEVKSTHFRNCNKQYTWRFGSIG